MPWPLLAVLAVQAALSAWLVPDRTAFGDEALYLTAGHLEWAHWLHGTPVPGYVTWFSGAPVIYPPVGAIADSLGGLTAARGLSVIFMLGVTALLWSTARRLLGDDRAAFFAAALFAVLAPTLHLGSYATYDAPALLLLAAAAWCAAGVTGGGDGGHAARRVIAAGVLLALANATKYATALFDPTVICLVALASWPHAGRPHVGRPHAVGPVTGEQAAGRSAGRAAARRAALLAGATAAVLGLLLLLGGPGYLTGISVTTTGRPPGHESASLVVGDAWAWTAVVVAPAVAAVLVAVARRQWRLAALLGLLAVSALLAPAGQARIQTTTSLNKHVDFGAWFAAVAAGYLLSTLIASVPGMRLARVAASAAVAALVPVAALGMAQARGFVDWPDVTGLVKVVRPLTGHGGHFLVETSNVLQFYLPGTKWQQWSGTNESLTYYQRAIARHYFSVVVLGFNETPATDYAITLDLNKTSGYRMVATVHSGQTDFYVWRYTGLRL